MVAGKADPGNRGVLLFRRQGDQTAARIRTGESRIVLQRQIQSEATRGAEMVARVSFLVSGFCRAPYRACSQQRNSENRKRETDSSQLLLLNPDSKLDLPTRNLPRQ